MTTSHTQDDIHLAGDGTPPPLLRQFCAYATLAIPLVAIPGLGLLILTSDVASPRDDPAGYLTDLATSGAPLGLAPWLLGAIPVLSLFLWLGIYWTLTPHNRRLTQTATGAGLVAVAIQPLVAVMGAAIVGHLVPAWSAVSDSAGRAFVESDFLIAQWGFEASLAAFDMFLFVAQVAAALVMLRTHQTPWVVAGWLGLASAAGNLLGVFAFEYEPLQPFGAIGFFIGMAWIVATGIALLRAPAER
jgi:hypothetical protein